MMTLLVMDVVCMSMQKMADKCKMLDKDLHTLVHKEFWGGFTPHASLTTSAGILLHTLRLKPIDSTNDNTICTHPVPLGYKNKENILT